MHIYLICKLLPRLKQLLDKARHIHPSIFLSYIYIYIICIYIFNMQAAAPPQAAARLGALYLYITVYFIY